MQVINVKKLKNSVKVTFENGEILNLNQSVFAEYPLYINKIISEKTLKFLKEENEINRFYDLIYNRFKICNYSPKKAEEFLKKKGAKKQQIKIILEKLRKYDFLSEESLMEDLVESANAKNYGYNKIIKILKNKGISENFISKLKIDEKYEKEKCAFHIKRLAKKYTNKNCFNIKKSIYSSLINLGFSSDISLDLIDNYSFYNHKSEINMLKLDYKKLVLKYSKKYNGYELKENIVNSLINKGYRLSDINEVKENENIWNLLRILWMAIILLAN